MLERTAFVQALTSTLDRVSGRTTGSNCKVHFLDVEWTEPFTPMTAKDFTASKMWRLVLGSDGHPVQHLQLLTRKRMSLRVIESTVLPEGSAVPQFASRVPGPHLRRQIFLDDDGGRTYLYCASWWSQAQYEALMNNDDHVVVWEQIINTKLEMSRKVERFHFGSNKNLEATFETPGPFWAREYCFQRSRTPFAAFYEVFSPRLAEHIGDMTTPRQNTTG